MNGNIYLVRDEDESEILEMFNAFERFKGVLFRLNRPLIFGSTFIIVIRTIECKDVESQRGVIYYQNSHNYISHSMSVA